LQLYYDQNFGTMTSNMTVEAHQATAAWDATTATWANASNNVGQLGGTVVVSPSVSNVWSVFPVTSIVQSWLAGTSPNDGFVVQDANETTCNQGGVRYEASRFAYQGETATYPQLVLTWGTPGVTLNPVTTIHATGAELSWPAYTDGSAGSNPADDLAEYQVYRSVFQSFIPSPDTLVAPVPAGATSFTDTTATPTAPGSGALGNAYYYMAAVKTQDGTIIPGPVRLVRLPTAGSTVQIIDASGDSTLSSGQPGTSQQQFAGQAWLGVGDNSATYGTTRAVVSFPALSSTLPTGVTVTEAHLKMWAWFNLNTGGGSGTYEAHALTQNFEPATATWNSASTGTAWTTPGGAFSPTMASTVSGLTNDPNRQNWPVTAIAQDWLATPADQHGLLVKLSGETSSDPQERELFLNSSAPETALRPELVVTYTDATPQNTYYVPDLPDPMTASSSYTVNVTLTNTTNFTWTAAAWVLSYHWLLPDGTEVSTTANQAQTPLPADMAPGAVATVAAHLNTPDNSGSGSTRTGYTLAWDLYDKTTATWLSGGIIGGVARTSFGRLGAGQAAAALDSSAALRLAPGNAGAAPARASSAAPAGAVTLAAGNTSVPALPQGASVEQPTSNLLGLEKFYQYTGVNTGSGSALLNNADNGNVVWTYNAFSHPSRGFRTFVRLSYNSMDT